MKFTVEHNSGYSELKTDLYNWINEPCLWFKPVDEVFEEVNNSLNTTITELWDKFVQERGLDKVTVSANSVVFDTFDINSFVDVTPYANATCDYYHQSGIRIEIDDQNENLAPSAFMQIVEDFAGYLEANDYDLECAMNEIISDYISGDYPEGLEDDPEYALSIIERLEDRGYLYYDYDTQHVDSADEEFKKAAQEFKNKFALAA